MIEQPSSIPTQIDIGRATEAARNNVNILEAESVRLDRLVGSQKRELIVQEAAKRDIEDLIELAEGKLAILETEIDSSKLSLASITSQLDTANKSNMDTIDRIKVLENNLIESEHIIIERSQALEEREKQLTIRDTELQTQEDLIDYKIRILMEAIKAIT